MNLSQIFSSPKLIAPTGRTATIDPMQSERKVLAIVNDLMFNVKVQQAVRRAGLQVQFAGTAAAALEQAGQEPLAIVLDLNAAGFDPVDLVRQLKTDPATASIPIIAFISHVQIDRKKAALAAGCNEVLARSVFEQKLPDLLRAATPAGRPDTSV